MLDKLQQAFWKALTPDLLPEELKAPAEPGEHLSAEIVAAIGGVDNLKAQQPVALTRVRVALHDASRIDRQALTDAGVVGVMALEGDVLHLITGLHAQG